MGAGHVTCSRHGRWGQRVVGTFRAAAIGTAWSAALAGAGLSAPPAAEEETDAARGLELVQFELPAAPAEGGAPPALPTRLEYEYSYGSESAVDYRADADLDERLRDDFLILTPELHGIVTYRPADWIETRLEMIIDREIKIQEEKLVTLPDGEMVPAPQRTFSLLVDQAYVTFKNYTGPGELTFGRRNYEDERHWLWDTSIDVVRAEVKFGAFRAEAFAGREQAVDLDMVKRERPDRINTYTLYTDYRGIEDIKLAAYAVMRDDRSNQEGRPIIFGLRSQGRPTSTFGYWVELAHMRGRDEDARSFSAFGLDVGATYRFAGVPLNPSITLAYATGTGDDNPERGSNNEFRQTGLQSNEVRFGGVAEFIRYGEVLDPELSNLEILTFGLGFWPIQDVSVDLVYHRYRLNEYAEELRSPLTARMNQVEMYRSKRVGQEFDVVVGLRSIFGVRRLGMDLRFGWFFPGKAFLTNIGDEDNPLLHRADTGVAAVAKIWW
jgi:hypothetical protein